MMKEGILSFKTSNIEHRTSNIEHRTSNIEHRTKKIHTIPASQQLFLFLFRRLDAGNKNPDQFLCFLQKIIQ